MISIGACLTKTNNVAVLRHLKLIALVVRRKNKEDWPAIGQDNDANSLAGYVAVLEASRDALENIII